MIEQTIFLWENILEQEDKAHQETQEEFKSYQNIIAEKKLQLTGIKNQIERILVEINRSRATSAFSF